MNKQKTGTGKVIHDIGCTLIWLEQKHKVWRKGQESAQPCIEHKQDAQVPVYDGGVMKGFANGNIVVKRHGN